MKFVLLWLLIFISLPAMAEEKISADMVLRGIYKETRINPGFKTPLHSAGRFVIAPSQGIIWQAEKPFVTKTVITPKGIGQEINDKKSMNMDAGKIPFLTKLYEMIGGVLAGNWDILEHDFKIQRSGTEKKWQVILTTRKPDDADMPFRSITINGSQFADKIVLDKKDGGSHILTFKNQKLSPLPLAADENAAFKMVSP